MVSKKKDNEVKDPTEDIMKEVDKKISQAMSHVNIGITILNPENSQQKKKTSGKKGRKK